MSDGRTNTKFTEKRKEVIRYYRDNVYWTNTGEILEWNAYNRDKILHLMMEKFIDESEYDIERILEDYHKRINT